MMDELDPRENADEQPGVTIARSDNPTTPEGNP